ncbi:MAG: TonB family protein [Gemmatimonadota bacterium]|jgi:protein TonB
MDARAVPWSEIDDSESANESFKRASESWLWSAFILATVLHFCLFVFWPSMTAQDLSFNSSEIEAIALPPEIEIPAAPETIARPATPVISDLEIDPDITIAPTTFLENPVERLPEPRVSEEEAEQLDLAAVPVFTPYTVAPALVNRDEIARLLTVRYPPLLRQAGIGGTVRVHVFIDEEGRVQNAIIAATSNYPRLDEAALEVAGEMRFSPAFNRDRKVPVWISIPVVFEVR